MPSYRIHLVIGFLLVFVATVFDTDFTGFLRNSLTIDPTILRLFDESVFEGGIFGINDFINISTLILVIAYPFLNKKISSSLFKVFCKFYLINVVTIFLIVHGLKNSLGRIRPHAIESTSEITPWFYLIPEITRTSGSFPSGHTANIGILLAISIFYSWVKKSNLSFYLLLLPVIFMGVTRSNLNQHWFSDWSASIFICIAVPIFYLSTLPKQHNATSAEGYKPFKSHGFLLLKLFAFFSFWALIRRKAPVDLQHLLTAGFWVSFLALLKFSHKPRPITSDAKQ